MSTGTVWPRAIAHFDLDQFYAAVEILDFPELKGQPVIVGGSPHSRGVVCTASYEARKFGVHSAMASSQAARLCPRAVWRTPRMERYAEKSREVRAVFERYTDAIEPLSMDEAFLDLTASIPLFGPPEKMARRIKDDVRRETSLVISAGVAANKFLAKVASDLKKPDGFVVVPPDPEAARRFLAPLPASRLWGVGPKTAERLNALNLTTVGQIAQADVAWLSRRLGQHSAEHLIKLAQGIDAREVETSGEQKSISHENTFAADLHDLNAMERELLYSAEEVARRLREDQLCCLGVTLKVRLADLTRLTRATTFEEPVDVAEPLYRTAVELLRTRVDRRQGVRLLGIAAHKLVQKNSHSETLFPDEGMARQRKLAHAMDHLREKFGDESIRRGRFLEARQPNTGTPSERPEK